MSSVKRTWATVGLTTVEAAVVKATFDDDDKPKPKHVKTISEYVALELAGSGYDIGSQHKQPTLVEMFRKRINSYHNASLSWRVVIKSLSCIHILFRECGTAFIDEFAESGQHRVFTLSHAFVDNTTSNSIVHSTFVRKYSRYLHEKVEVYKKLSYNVERRLDQHNKDFFKQFDVASLVNILPLIMAQLQCVTEVEPQVNGATFMVHKLVQHAMLLLIKDSLRIYSSIQLILWELLCSFQRLNLEQAQWVRDRYRKYFALNERFQTWFAKAIKLGIVNHEYSPNFNTLPKSLATKLEKYISDQEQVAIPDKKKKKKKKSIAKKSKSEHENRDENDAEDGDEDDVNAPVAHLQDVLDAEHLNAFSESAQKYKQQTTAVPVVPDVDVSTTNAAVSSQEQDLLGFSDQYNQNSANFVNSLNIKTPEAVSNDQFLWSNWGEFEHELPKTSTAENNNIDSKLDDWWSTIPNHNQNDEMSLMDSAHHQNVNGSQLQQQQQTATDNPFAIGIDLGGSSTGYTDAMNASMSGGQARKLKQKPTAVVPNADPFMDLLNFN